MRLSYKQFTTAPEVDFKTATLNKSLNVMRTKPRSSIAVPAEFVQPKTQDIVVIAVHTDSPKLSYNDVDSALNMSQVNGIHREQSPQDASMAPPGRVISTSMIRQAAEPTPVPDQAQWSSAVGHASTGKSGRVIERLQGDIDRLNREKKLLKMRFEEVEKANENLSTTTQYLQDRNSNYEQSHEANLRQLARKERQVEDLKDELQRERLKTTKAEEAAEAAAVSEDTWREQSNQARAIAQQREAEYDAIVACRNMDNERHQTGLNKLRTGFETFMRQREEDLETQKKLEIVAEQQRQTIQHLEDLTKKLNASFKAYKSEIDSAISDMRNTADGHDKTVLDKLEEMQKTTGEMRWVMCVEKEVNHKVIPPMPPASQLPTSRPSSPTKEKRPQEQTPSPSKKKSIDFRLHRRKDSKVSK